MRVPTIAALLGALLAPGQAGPPLDVTDSSADLVIQPVEGGESPYEDGFLRLAYDEDGRFGAGDRYCPDAAGWPVDAETNYTERVPCHVTGLAADTRYRYRLEWREADQPGAWNAVGRERTFTTARAPLAYAPPPLDDPLTLEVADSGLYATPPRSRDCVVQFPERVVVTGPVQLIGCHDVVIRGGHIWIGGTPDGPPETVGLKLQGYTGTAHVEGVELGGPGVTDGIWASPGPAALYPDSKLQLVGSRVDETHARIEHTRDEYPGGTPMDCRVKPDDCVEHPACVQLWQGPQEVLIDRFTCNDVVLEGVNLDTGNCATYPASCRADRAARIELRHVNANLSPVGRQCFEVWHPFRPVPIEAEDLYCATAGAELDSALWPRPSRRPAWWASVKPGRPPGGDYVDEEDVGLGYVSPGYREPR
jgi:hypothetical protein